jgi:ssDNA-specific exonuclease RecJ
MLFCIFILKNLFKLILNLTAKVTKEKFKKFYELIKAFKRTKIKDF